MKKHKQKLDSKEEKYLEARKKADQFYDGFAEGKLKFQNSYHISQAIQKYNQALEAVIIFGDKKI